MALGIVRDLGKTASLPARQVSIQARAAGDDFAKKFHAPAIDKIAKPKKAPMYGGLMMKGRS